MAARRRPLIIITPGDPAGIGPEIVYKTLRSNFEHQHADFLCVGAAEPFRRLGATLVESTPEDILNGARPPRNGLWFSPAPEAVPARSRRLLPGFQSGWSIETAVRLIRAGAASALVTGPIHKERLQKGGYGFPGHTEMLAKLCGVKNVTMMLANERLRVSLVTTHIGIHAIPRALTKQSITCAVDHTVESLMRWWKIRKPRIAIAALNPHAGEGGIFGKEELRTIGPAIQALQIKYDRRCELLGPLPADTLFAKHFSNPNGSYDAVVCMYHDQGLIPVKQADFARTVNITLGLPMIRTSVDHGVAFDIAGKNLADPSSLQSAISLAIRLSTNASPISGGSA